MFVLGFVLEFAFWIFKCRLLLLLLLRLCRLRLHMLLHVACNTFLFVIRVLVLMVLRFTLHVMFWRASVVVCCYVCCCVGVVVETGIVASPQVGTSFLGNLPP